MISVIVPAHNEARVIRRLLGPLISTARPGEFEVIVVANGCTDDTADVAAAFGPPVRVLSTPVASKSAALAAGDDAAAGFPRVYADADIELGAEDVRALARALDNPGILAAAPHRELALAGRPWLIRWYYDVWSRLPEVQRGLFGRGVICVSEVGHKRIASLPQVMADDLIASLSFTPAERVIADGARVVVHPPRTVGDLLRRRVRATVGVTQIELAADTPEASARTRPGDLLAIARQSPVMAARVAVFAVMSVLARAKARRAIARSDYAGWLRDESSRT
jgi:glycosyltransferase involved in cell wall biosynthesis